MNSENKNGKVHVFFADFGDSEEVTIENIAAISDDLITRLPFQVNCSFRIAV